MKYFSKTLKWHDVLIKNRYRASIEGRIQIGFKLSFYFKITFDDKKIFVGTKENVKLTLLLLWHSSSSSLSSSSSSPQCAAVEVTFSNAFSQSVLLRVHEGEGWW